MSLFISDVKIDTLHCHHKTQNMQIEWINEITATTKFLSLRVIVNSLPLILDSRHSSVIDKLCIFISYLENRIS